MFEIYQILGIYHHVPKHDSSTVIGHFYKSSQHFNWCKICLYITYLVLISSASAVSWRDFETSSWITDRSGHGHFYKSWHLLNWYKIFFVACRLHTNFNCCKILHPATMVKSGQRTTRQKTASGRWTVQVWPLYWHHRGQFQVDGTSLVHPIENEN